MAVASQVTTPQTEPQTSDPEIHLVGFGYIHKDKFNAFKAQMGKWSIDLLPDDFDDNESRRFSRRLLSYPDVQSKLLDEDDRANLLRSVPPTSRLSDRVQLVSVRLIYVWKKLYLEEMPSHYPFRMILEFHFKVSTIPPAMLSNRESCIKQLAQATDEIRSFIGAICNPSQNTPSPDKPGEYWEYKPVYWFLVNLPDHLHGLLGTVRDVESPKGRAIKIERGIPEASYIIYNTYPGRDGDDLLDADLGLLSVVWHVVERSHRKRLENLRNEIDAKLGKLGNYKTGPANPEECQTRIEEITALQAEIRKNVTEYYALRRDAARMRGLVLRVREKCSSGGSPSKKNLYDILCEDALALIEDDITKSEGEIETLLSDVNNRLDIAYRQQNDLRSHESSRRSQSLQKIGQLLQTTGIAYIVFQIYDKLAPSPSGSGITMDHWIRIGVGILITIIAGIVAYRLIKSFIES